MAVIFAMVAWMVSRPVVMASREMNMEGYRAMIRGQERAVGDLLKLLADKKDIKSELNSLVREAARNGAIMIREGESSVSLDHSWVHDTLRQARSKLAPEEKRAVLTNLKERLALLAEAADQMDKIQPPDPEARAVLAGILSGPEFRHSKNKRDSWWQRQRKKMQSIGQAIGEALGKILRFALNVPVAVGIIIAASGYLVYRVWWKAPRRAVGDSPPARETLLATGPDGFLKGAENAAATSDYRQAIRQIYLALLARLDRAGYIHYVPWRTNWEYMRSIREKSPDMTDAFEPMTGLYEHKWYGLERCGRPDYDEGLRLYKKALQEGGL